MWFALLEQDDGGGIEGMEEDGRIAVECGYPPAKTTSHDTSLVVNTTKEGKFC